MESDQEMDTVEISPARKLPLETQSSLVHVDVGALSHPGKTRTNNEDHFLVARFDRSMQTLFSNLPNGCVPEQSGETAYAFLVADGMGGQAAGEIASGKAISALIELVLRTPDWILRLEEPMMQEVLRRMDERFRRVTATLEAMALQNPRLAGMGTTMTLACSLGADLIVGHVGDSRAYLFRRGQLYRLTRDHTYAQVLADAGKIRPEQAATHPLRHVLTNVIGSKGDDVRADIDFLQLLDGDQLLLCTDGLTEMVGDTAIAAVLTIAASATAACQTLIDHALDAGGKDNVSVVLGRYRLPAGLP